MFNIEEEILKYLKNEMTRALELCKNEDAELYVVDALWPECGLRGVNDYEVYFSERRISDYDVRTCCEVRFNPKDSVLKTIIDEPLCFIFVQSDNGEVEKVCKPNLGIKVIDLDQDFLSIVPDNLSEVMSKMVPLFKKVYKCKGSELFIGIKSRHIVDFSISCFFPFFHYNHDKFKIYNIDRNEI